MYSDQSKNFMTATQGVDMIMGGLHAGLASALSLGVNYEACKFGGGVVSLKDYNAVVRVHNDLIREVRRLDLLIQLREAEIEILRRRVGRQ